MNTPTDRVFRLLTPEYISLRRMLITDITISQDSPVILYQIPFELTKAPSRVWKQVLIDSWYSTTQHKGRISKTVIWVFYNRILINKIPIDLVRNDLESLVAATVEKTNKLMMMRSQLVI